jgi:hypothetical protein
MKVLLFSLAIFTGFVPALAIDHTLVQAEKDAANVKTLVLNGSEKEATRLLKLAPKLIALGTVVLDGIKEENTASGLVASVAACNSAHTISFRNCALQTLPVNLRMLTQIKSFSAEHTTVADGEQFYNTIADMPNVVNVTVTGSDFRSLPKSFSRLRVMDNIHLVNSDMQLASGYDVNTKTADELRVTESVEFGFGTDALHLNYTCYNAEAAKSHVQMFRDVLQGAYRESNVFYSPVHTRAFQKPHPLVKPPVKDLDVFPDVYSYNALTGSCITYGSGTKLSIPANAFEDANGAPVTGNVDITYREFRDPVDIVLSGIPMTYDSGGVVENFESAGMFEISASQNGSEVFLREGMQIDMDFAVVDTASTFNFYRLDEKKGWQYLESTGTVEREMIPAADSGVSPWSDAVTYYVNSLGDIHSATLSQDTTSFDQRYADTSYLALNKYYNNNQQYYHRERRKSSSKLYFRRYGSGVDYTLVKVHGVNYYNGNPEMDVYQGYYWKIDGKQSSSQIRTEYGKKSGINDMRVVNEGGQFFLELKYHWGFKRIAAEPVKMTDHKKAEYLSDRTKENLFKNYNRRLQRRRDECTKDIAQTVKVHKRQNARASRDSVRVFNRTLPKMNETENGLAFGPWNSYVKQEKLRTISAWDRAFIASGNAVQALKLTGMGVYNCDQVKRLVRPAEAFAKKVAIGAAAVVPFIVYVIDKARNMVLTYTGNGGGVPITYGSQATNTLMMVDGSGNLYLSDETQFSEGVREGNDGTFNGKMISGPETTPESVRQAVFPE